MPTKYIIVFTADYGQPIQGYWNGAAQTAIDSTMTPDTAHFFDTVGAARMAAGSIQATTPAQLVQVIPVNTNTAIQVPTGPGVLPPAPPASSTPSASGGTTTGGTTTGG